MQLSALASQSVGLPVLQLLVVDPLSHLSVYAAETGDTLELMSYIE